MEDKIKSHVNTAFENAPNTKGVHDLKEEMISNLIDKYYDLLASGTEEEKAYSIVISGIGNVNRLIEDIENLETTEEDIKNKKKSAFLTAIAVALYILSPIPVIAFGDVEGFGNISVIFLLVLVALATGIIIYNSRVYGNNKSEYKSDDLVGEFIDWKQNKSKVNALRGSLGGFIWLIGTCIYFVVSFMFGAWAFSWIIFLITGAVHILLDTVIRLVGMKNE